MTELRRKISLRRHYTLFLLLTLAALAYGKYALMAIMLGANAAVWSLSILVISADIRELEKPTEDGENPSG